MKRYYIFLTHSIAVRVPRRVYRWLTEHTAARGLVEMSGGLGENQR